MHRKQSYVIGRSSASGDFPAHSKIFMRLDNHRTANPDIRWYRLMAVQSNQTASKRLLVNISKLFVRNVSYSGNGWRRWGCLACTCDRTVGWTILHVVLIPECLDAVNNGSYGVLDCSKAHMHDVCDIAERRWPRTLATWPVCREDPLEGLPQQWQPIRWAGVARSKDGAEL